MKINMPFIGGLPDVWYSGDKDDLWVEYKFLVVPKRDDSPIHIDLSPLQQRWLGYRFLEGRNVAVIAGCKEGGVFMRGMEWEQTWSTGQFKALIVPRAELAAQIIKLTMRNKA